MDVGMDLRIAICDDEQHQREYMELLVAKWIKNSSLRAESEGKPRPKLNAKIDCFESAEQFKMLREDAYDILLLDIQMGGQDGVSLARELRANSENLVIIFVTGVPDFVQDGYDVSALHYLMKPVDENKLHTVLDRAATQALDKTRTGSKLLLPVDGDTVRVNLRDILYIESFAHYLEIVQTTGSITVKMPAYKLEQQLGQGFIRCHRSYLVALRHISKITKTDVVLDCGKAIPLSRRMYGAVTEAFMAYVSGAG